MKIIILVIFIAFTITSYGQNRKYIENVYAILVETDAVDIMLFYNNPSRNGYNFLYNIFHLRIVTARNDSINVGFVYNINMDTDSLFGFKKMLGRPFLFLLSDFTPAISDFPLMANCDYNSGYFVPNKNSYLFNKNYKSIFRVLELHPIHEDLWLKLKKYYDD